MTQSNLFRYVEVDDVLVRHYETHRREYEDINRRLTELREAFVDADRETQIRLLHQSYIFAVASIQTPVPIHEKAFEAVMAGEPLPRAFKSVNYNRQKIAQIEAMLPETDMWDRVRNALVHADLDTAHEILLKETKGVGTAKAPFMLAMLGFTEKMCVDANVIRLMNLPGAPDLKSVEAYDSLCAAICAKAPSLRRFLSPFMIQWIMFDYQRGEVSRHDVWWKAATETLAGETAIETATAA